MTNTTLFAQPYDITATGFYFGSLESYDAQAAQARNSFGQPVEEFEIQFIDGEALDAALAEIWGLNQGNFPAFLEAATDWEDQTKQLYIIAVGECGYDHADIADEPDCDDIEILHLDDLEAYAEELIEEGAFGDVPEALRPFIDIEKIAADLSLEYCETTVAGETIIYALR